ERRRENRRSGLCGTLCSQPAAQHIREDVVGEQPLAAELHDREELAVRGLEVGVATDVDLDELEAQLVAEPRQLLARALAQVAALRVEQGDRAGHLIVNRTERTLSGPPSVG